jgi:NAD(P)H-dependent FMN reductase
MPIPKVLVFAGSIRTGSFNARLAAIAAKEIARAEADVTRISLLDFPLPLYDGDLEARSGPPENAVKLKRMFCAHQGVFIASPEYNASFAPLLKNTIDWISRVREKQEPPLAAYRNRVYALGAASNGTFGGTRSLMALRQSLELG